jgi:hypothetical protein
MLDLCAVDEVIHGFSAPRRFVRLSVYALMASESLDAFGQVVTALSWVWIGDVLLRAAAKG